MNTDSNNEMLRSIASDQLPALASLSEVALDATMNESLLRDIPVLGSIVSLARAGKAIQDYHYLNKIARFLSGLSEANLEVREELVAHLEDADSKVRFSENVMLLIDKSDDVRKPEIMGRLWAACAKGEIELEKTMRLCSMLNRAYWSDLVYLRTMELGVQREGKEIAESLQAAGLVSSYGFEGGNFTESNSAGTRYGRNSYGELLVKFGLKKFT